MRPSPLIVAILAAVCLQAVVVQTNPFVFAADDSLFYLKVAQNAAAGFGSTFNQIIPTNGYHPLWLAVLASLAIVFKDPDSLFRVSLLLSSFLVGICAYLFARLLAGRRPEWAWPGAAALIALLGALGIYLSEAHLSVLTILCTSFAVLNFRDKPGYLNASITGLGAGLMILARLDMLFVASILAVYVWHKGGFRALLLYGLSCGALVAPYLAWNIVNFGYITPISGAIHSDFPKLTLNIVGPGIVGWSLAIIALVGLPLVWRSGPGSLRVIYVILFLGATLQLAYVVLFSETGIKYHWYWTLFMILASWTVFLASKLIFGLWRPMTGPTQGRSKSALMVTLVAVMAVFPTLARSNRSGNLNSLLEVPRWLNSVLPEPASIAVSDSPGVIALWSHHRIVAVDGLMGDYDFQEQLIRKGIARTLQDAGICYFLHTGEGIAAEEVAGFGASESGPHRLAFQSTLYDQPVGTLSFTDDQLVGRLNPNLPSIQTVLLWRFQDICATSGASAGLTAASNLGPRQ